MPLYPSADPEAERPRRWLVPLLFATVALFIAWAANLALTVQGLRAALAERVGWLQTIQEVEQALASLPADPEGRAAELAALRPRLRETREAAGQAIAADDQGILARFDALLRDLDALNAQSPEADIEAALRGADRLTHLIRRDNGLISARLAEAFSSLFLTIPASLVLAGATMIFAVRSNRQATRPQALGEALGAELMRHQETLAQLETTSVRYELVVRGAADGIWEWDPTTGEIDYSPRFEEMLGVTDLPRRLDAWLDLVHPDDRAMVQAALDDHVRGLTPHIEVEYRARHADGRWRWMLARGLAERHGHRVRVAGSQTDITDRRSAAAIEERHRLLQQVTESVGIGVATVDATGRLADASATLRRLTAAWPEVAAWWTAARDAAGPAPALLSCPDCGAPAPRDQRLADVRDPQGRRQVFELTWTGHGHGLARGEPPVVLMVRDVTARTIGEEAEAAARRKLARTQEELRRVIERVPDGVLILHQNRLVYANATLGRMLGVHEPETLIGRLLNELIADEDDPNTSDLNVLRARLRSSDGREVPVEFSRPVSIEFEGAPATLLVARDLSERVQFEAQLRLADRLASLGTLSAGLAHEINNPLAYVLGNLELLMMDLERRGAADPSVSQRLERAYEGAERVKQIVANLRNFARTGDEGVATLPLARSLEATLPLVARLVQERARFEVDVPDDLLVHASPAWVGQILLNLIVNAAQAIPPGAVDQNRVRVEARQDRDSVLIDVIDTGGGIPASARERIFDPFFTTKPPGEGTGLGLFICHELARRMGGTLVLLQTSPAGTTFRLRLRSATRPAEVAPAPVAPARSLRSARVLVIDDEKPLTEMFEACLETHRVRSVHTAQEGLDAALAEDWDVIFCDAMLPDFSGMELFDRLRARRPEMAERVVFVTAGSWSPEIMAFFDRVPNPRLLKPFDVQDLVALVEERAAAAK